MLVEDHLTLRLIRLKPSEEWLNKKEGFSFIFFKEGTGKYVSKTTTQRLVPGDVLVLNRTAGGKLFAHDKGDFIFNFFSIFLEHMFPLFGSDEISFLRNVTENFKAAKLYPADSNLALECQQLLKAVPAQFDLEHRSQLLRIAAAILSAEFKDAQAQKGGFDRPEERMIHVFEKLSAAELLNLSVGELANKFSCSRRHLNRLFHQHFGLSVATLRMEMRLLNAVNLLRDPQAKVINVAEQCGFNHLGLFNTCFKRRFGASPGQWRKLNLQPDSTNRKAEVKHVCPFQANGLCSWSGPSKMSIHQDAMIDVSLLSGSQGGASAVIPRNEL
jgi:AraC-like DNA-binding protein